MTLLAKHIRRNTKNAWQNVEDKVIVVTPLTKKIHILSGTGGRIWQLLEEPKTLEGIMHSICEEYEVTPTDAEKDITGFLEDLLEKEIVAYVSEHSAR